MLIAFQSLFYLFLGCQITPPKSRRSQDGQRRAQKLGCEDDRDYAQYKNGMEGLYLS